MIILNCFDYELKYMDDEEFLFMIFDMLTLS